MKERKETLIFFRFFFVFFLNFFEKKKSCFVMTSFPLSCHLNQILNNIDNLDNTSTRFDIKNFHHINWYYLNDQVPLLEITDL